MGVLIEQLKAQHARDLSEKEQAYNAQLEKLVKEREELIEAAKDDAQVHSLAYYYHVCSLSSLLLADSFAF